MIDKKQLFENFAAFWPKFVQEKRDEDGVIRSPLEYELLAAYIILNYADDFLPKEKRGRPKLLSHFKGGQEVFKLAEVASIYHRDNLTVKKAVEQSSISEGTFKKFRNSHKIIWAKFKDDPKVIDEFKELSERAWDLLVMDWVKGKPPSYQEIEDNKQKLRRVLYESIKISGPSGDKKS